MDVVWLLLAEEMKRAAVPEEQILYLEPYFRGVQFSEELLGSLVGMKSVLEAKIVVMQYLLDNEVVGNTPGFEDDLMTKLALTAAEQGLRVLVGELRNVVADIPCFLEAQGSTETDLMLDPRLGLNEMNQVLYQAGSFTIADLLMSQPGVVFHNG